MHCLTLFAFSLAILGTTHSASVSRRSLPLGQAPSPFAPSGQLSGNSGSGQGFGQNLPSTPQGQGDGGSGATGGNGFGVPASLQGQGNGGPGFGGPSPQGPSSHPQFAPSMASQPPSYSPSGLSSNPTPSLAQQPLSSGSGIGNGGNPGTQLRSASPSSGGLSGLANVGGLL